jgi:Glycosyl transferases group 1
VKQPFRSYAIGTPSPDAALWLTDWLDSEDDDFRWAWETTGIATRVIRTPPMGLTVGTSTHRLRSWPTYAALAARAEWASRATRLVAWQPILGEMVGLLSRTRCHPPALTVVNPVLTFDSSSWQQRLALAGLAQAQHVLVASRAAAEAVQRLGLRPEQVEFVPFGVRARRQVSKPPGNYLLAVGRDARDWPTLAHAARGLEVEVVVTGPRELPEPGPLRLAPQVQGEAFFEMLEGAAALVLPLARTDRSIGHNSMLAAMAVGRPVVATRSLGIEDYLDETTSILVPPHDPDALHEALRHISDPAVASSMGAAALAAARSRFSLQRFVRDVDRISGSGMGYSD